MVYDSDPATVGMVRAEASRIDDLEKKLEKALARLAKLEGNADQPCEDCRGTGTDREEGGDGYMQDCNCYACHGTGRVKSPSNCVYCEGTGEASDPVHGHWPCRNCDGKGHS